MGHGRECAQELAKRTTLQSLGLATLQLLRPPTCFFHPAHHYCLPPDPRHRLLSPPPPHRRLPSQILGAMEDDGQAMLIFTAAGFTVFDQAGNNPSTEIVVRHRRSWASELSSSRGSCLDDEEVCRGCKLWRLALPYRS